MSAVRKRVAVFGGAFDPFHNGHVAAVRLLLSDLSISRVLIVPSGERPDKQGGSKATERLEMTKLGVQAAFGGEFDGSSVAVAFSSSDLLLWAAGAWRSMRSLGASAGSAASLTSFN